MKHNDAKTDLIAVVTGGGTGLGLACAKHLLDKGYKVWALGKDQEEIPENKGYQYLDFDVTDKAAIKKFSKQVGAVDALVNAAGIILHDGQEFSDEGFDRVMAVNVAGTQSISFALKDALIARKGSIVNFASMWSIFGSGRNPAYSTSKGAIQQLTRSLAVAWAGEGVRVNAVAPGWIRTRMSVNAMADPVRSKPILDRIPQNRWGEPPEVARAVGFLISDEASYINGVTLPVDGGFSVA